MTEVLTCEILAESPFIGAIDAELERLRARIDDSGVYWTKESFIAQTSDWVAFLHRRDSPELCDMFFLLQEQNESPAFAILWNEDNLPTIWKTEAYQLRAAGKGFDLPDDSEWEITDNVFDQMVVANLLRHIPGKVAPKSK